MSSRIKNKSVFIAKSNVVLELLEPLKIGHEFACYKRSLEALYTCRFSSSVCSPAGVPRQHRGEIWKFLSEQYLLRQTVPSRPPSNHTPYKELLKQLTSQQHAILIDLGKTRTHTHADARNLLFLTGNLEVLKSP